MSQRAYQTILPSHLGPKANYFASWRTWITNKFEPVWRTSWLIICGGFFCATVLFLLVFLHIILGPSFASFKALVTNLFSSCIVFALYVSFRETLNILLQKFFLRIMHTWKRRHQFYTKKLLHIMLSDKRHEKYDKYVQKQSPSGVL